MRVEGVSNLPWASIYSFWYGPVIRVS